MLVRVCLLIIVFLCIGALEAGAEVRTYFSKGSWETSAGTAEDGNRVCMVNTLGPDKGFYVKYFEGDSYFQIQMFKSGWRVPNDVTAEVAIEFDRMGAWSGTAFGINTGSLSGLQLPISLDQFALFVEEFKAARQMAVMFLEGNEGGWTARMNGSAAAMGKMVECMNILSPPSTSQPFDPPSSQPFNPPASQPFSSDPPQSPPASKPRPKDPFVIDPDGRSA